MKEISGRIFIIAEENKPVAGCTVSKQLHQDKAVGISIFSMAEHTDISAESYEYHKLCMVHQGSCKVYDTDGNELIVQEDDCVITQVGIPVGIKTNTGCIYTELSMRKESQMNQLLKAGEVFKLGELLPYQKDKIVNMDLISDDKLKFVIMSFDEGTGLSEHAAPGEALVFALDGEAIIGYEGKEYHLKAGETFKFDKMGKHSVTAVSQFKMALLLVF